MDLRNLDISSLQRAHASLAAAMAMEPTDETQTVLKRDAVIQRFEFTYELAWKTLKAYLETKDLFVLNPKDTLKLAHQQQLLSDANAWSELHMQRNLTTHTYDEKLAEDIYLFLKTKGLALFMQLKNALDSCL